MIPDNGNQPTATPERVLYPVNEVAVLLGVNPKTVWNLIEGEELVATRLRRRVLVHRDDLAAYIKALPTTAARPAAREAVAA